ncbi:hypothetical protein [Aminobacter sp. LjRoot7]|uniref:hypothetical protein n=1 Tax=Aminobacter sp. LjRoot7 TaxID=3342335 RepID=UPI003ECF77A4
MTEEFATAARVRDGLDRARNVELVLDERGGLVGRWASGDSEFRLGCELRFGLQGNSMACDRTLRESHVVLGKQCRVNVCISTWREEIASPWGPLNFAGLQKASGLVCHVAVERINYADARRPAVQGLSQDDLDGIAAFIRRPLEALLRRTVEEFQDHIGNRYARPVTGKLHWNWRNPAPEIAKLHEIGAEFTSTFTPERVTALPFDKYARDSNSGYGERFQVKDEPDVRVFIHPVDRDDPRFRWCEVELGEIKVPLHVQNFADVNLKELGLVPITPLPLLSVDLISHPFSLLLTPKSKPPAALTPAAADRAIEHLRTAWLMPKPSDYFSDVLIV